MDRGLELEKPISEKFVSFYYNNLAFSIDKLRLLYTDSSRFCVHSSDGSDLTFQGKENILLGMKSLDLEGAVADLQHGSINCICYNGYDFLISISGVLTVGQEKRNFSHVFILSNLFDDKKEDHAKKCVFFVRAEILTFHHISGGELSIDVCEESQGISFTSLTERADEMYAPANTSASGSGSTSNLTMSGSSRQANNHAGQQKYKHHRTDNYYPNHRHQRRPEGNDEDNGEKSDQDQTPKIIYEIIFAKNLPDGVTEDDIRNAFSKYGEIYQVKVFSEKKYATVSFPKTDGDYSVHEMYDRIMEEGEEFMICDTPVHLEPFDSRHKKNPYKQSYNHNRGRDKSFK